MEFSISAVMQELLGQIAEFTKREIIPRETRLHGEGVPRDQTRARAIASAGQEARAMGAASIPRVRRGLSLINYALVSETLGQTPFGH